MNIHNSVPYRNWLQLHTSHGEILHKKIYVQINKYCIHMCQKSVTRHSSTDMEHSGWSCHMGSRVDMNVLLQTRTEFEHVPMKQASLPSKTSQDLIEGGTQNVIPFCHPNKIVTTKHRCCKRASECCSSWKMQQISPVCKMADNGRLTVDQKVKVVLFYAETERVVVTQRRFRAHFGTRWAPWK